jgi:hypothetical protein
VRRPGSSAAAGAALMQRPPDTGMGLLIEAATALEGAAGACESTEDAFLFSELAERMRAYLATSRKTTLLGMPQLQSPTAAHERVSLHPANGEQSSHIRIVQ